MSVALAVGVELVVARSVGGTAALVYALALGAALLALLLRRLRSVLPPAARFERLVARPVKQTEPVGQLRSVERDVRLSLANSHDVHFSLRPMVREIVSVRLSRLHGIDLDREPERAEALIGAGKTWELVRPDREAPVDRRSRGWSRREIQELLDELERL
ncbi:MAG: hypothetical protein JXA87_15060 [Thermoleophilia bacterium]|nr:hypothetical protein [Thermoleophilia bacterium]